MYDIELTKKDLFKNAIRGKIFGGSKAMYSNLAQGTKFITSKQYPTQVLNTSVGRYIRINEDDINEETISDLLSTMLALNSFSYIEGEESEFDPEAKLMEAIKKSDEVDYTDIMHNKHLVELDDYDNVVSHNFKLAPQVIQKESALVEEDETKAPVILSTEDIEDDKTAEDLSGDAEQLSSIMSTLEGDGGDRIDTEKLKEEYRADLEIEQSFKDVATHQSKSCFHSDKSVISANDLKKLQPKVNQLLKAFEGTGGKFKRSTPAKKISSKDMAIDKDKVYVKKTAATGKHIKLNMLIDMSGSMGGSPVKNAVKLVWLMNQLAKKGYVTMKVLYSETDRNYKLTLPVDDSEILSLCRTCDSEGLAKTATKHIAELKHTNLICITDGNICDEPIEKTFWTKNKIIATGVYVNKSIKDYTEYSQSLNKWFNHAIVRKNLDELIEWLIRIGLK